MTDRAVVLDSDEALVLFELVHRWEDVNQDLQLEQGEREALWALSSALERVLVEPFEPNYSNLLERARQRLSTNAHS